MSDLKTTINSYLGLVFKIGVVLVIVSTLFLFTNLTTEFYDTAKFLSLLIFTGIFLLLLTLKFTLEGKVVLIRTPLDIPLVLLLVVAIVSTLLSPFPYVALLGNQVKIHGSLVSLAVYVLFYFILVNNLKSLRQIKWILYLVLLAAQVLALITLISYAGFKVLPAPWTHGPNFTPTGSSFSTAAILSLLLPLVVIQIVSGANLTIKLLNSLFLTIMGVTIALTGTWATWMAAVFGLVLTVSVVNPLRQITRMAPINMVALFAPMVVVVVVVFLSLMPPVGGAKNLLYTQAQNFPREIQLPFVTSWKIAVSAFRDMPFWGTAPGSFLFDFTTYKPLEFNSSKVWNLRFDTPFNEYLAILATLGGIGLIAFLSLTALFVSSAYKSLMLRNYEPPTINHQLKMALAISGICFFIILALHASTLAVWAVGLLILASFMVTNLSEGSRSWNGFGNIKNTFLKIASNSWAIDSSEETIRVDALPGVLLIITLSLILFTFYFASKFTLADYHHKKALNAVTQNQGVVAYNELVAAEKLNPVNDLYRTDLAQTNFALANAIASAKGPTPDSPAGTLTDQDKQNIQVLLQQSINEARTASTLNPKSAVNWEILGLLYRQIAGVAQNALVFSLDSYGRAIFQDPLNPVLRLNVGGVYYAVKNYDLAIRFFTDAINLKPDFANGYYNLSVALRDKGDLNGAQAAAEKVLTLLDSKSGDYKVASDYLTDLKNKNAPKAPEQSPPPAAQTSGALENKELPKVVNVGNPPEKIATPGAVKKPNSTPEPTAAP